MQSGQFLIITNNPIVKNIPNAEIQFVIGNQRQVFYAALNKAAGGHRLLSHPLAGSIKPADNPYRSMVLTALATEVDYAALNMLTYGLERMEAENTNRRDNLIIPQLDEDFQMIDKALLDQALPSLTERRV
ncbi:MAG TPA: GrdX family protein [Syntrophomonas sp.]|jgi:hypothetical protein|nr:GrdX family protein [Syntrophomonas sp.]HRW11682.1 GrdX family protein [Syntrophomonas sp.]